MLSNKISISLNNVSFEYISKNSNGKLIHKMAISDLSLNIFKGDVVGIIGLNGSGKSTLLNLFSKILTPTIGNIGINQKIFPMLMIKKFFNNKMSAREFSFLTAIRYGFNKKEAEIFVNTIYEKTKKYLKFDDPIFTYSSGMKRKLTLSFLNKQHETIYLFDEWIGEIDFFKKFQTRKNNSTFVITSHNLDLVERISNNCLWLNNGKKEMFDKTKNVVLHYRKFLQKYNS